MQTHKITPVVKPRTCVPRVKDVYDDDKDYDKDSCQGLAMKGYVGLCHITITFTLHGT